MSPVSFQMRYKDGKNRQEAEGGNENKDSDSVDLGKFVLGSVGKRFGHRYCFMKKIPPSRQDGTAATGRLQPTPVRFS